MSALQPAGFSGQTLRRLLDLLASGLLVPGGGSAAGIGGALGVSLLLMVATLPRKRVIPAPQGDELEAVTARLWPARDRLVHLAVTGRALPLTGIRFPMCFSLHSLLPFVVFPGARKAGSRHHRRPIGAFQETSTPRCKPAKRNVPQGCSTL